MNKDISTQSYKSSEECNSNRLYAPKCLWYQSSVPKDAWLPDSVKKMSSCEIEIDSQVCNIMNNQELKSKFLTFLVSHKFLAMFKHQ